MKKKDCEKCLEIAHEFYKTEHGDDLESCVTCLKEQLDEALDEVGRWENSWTALDEHFGLAELIRKLTFTEEKP